MTTTLFSASAESGFAPPKKLSTAVWTISSDGQRRIMYGDKPIGHLRRLNNLLKQEEYAVRSRAIDHLTRIMELKYQADIERTPMSHRERGADPPMPFDKSYLADTKFEGQLWFPSTRESLLGPRWFCDNAQKVTRGLDLDL